MLFALMMTMLLGGLWHGASWNFVLWGLIHGLLLIGHRLIKKMSLINSFFDKLPRTAPVLGWLITQYFIFMSMANIPFRGHQTLDSFIENIHRNQRSLGY